jgi:serum/glucocorticoid-regulated kinase 2
MVTVLLANHVNCDFEESDRPRPAHPNEGCFFFDISLPDEFIPPLVRAVKLDNLELVRLLLAHGADANVGFHTLHWQEIREPDGLIMHPSMYCGRVVQLAMDLGRRDMVRVLLEAGADIGMGQPVWKHHECMMMPMEDYFRILDGLRREAGAVKK